METNKILNDLTDPEHLNGSVYINVYKYWNQSYGLEVCAPDLSLCWEKNS